MNRLDLHPDNYFATMLKETEDQLRTIKNKQRYSGASGLLGYFVSNPGSWDISSSATNDYREFEVIFTASGKQPFPIELIQLDIRFGGTGDANKPVELPNGLWGYDDGTNFVVMFERNPEYDVSYSANETTYRWTFGFTVTGTLTYFIKPYISGSSDGEVEINQIGP